MQGNPCPAEASADESQVHIRAARKKVKKAWQYFDPLPAGFNENKEQLILYCRARLNELSGEFQKAIDLYNGLNGIEDSMERFDRLCDNIYPNLDEWPIYLEVIRVPAHANKDIKTYLGPGINYMKQTVVQVGSDTVIHICG